MNGSNFPEAWVSSIRLPAGTATETGVPPPAGVSDNDDTETSKAITLSAGASPKRTWAGLAPRPPGVGGGVEGTHDPPPPPPEGRAVTIASRRLNVNLASGLS